MKKLTLLTVMLTALSVNIFAQPAEPEPGMRWVIDEATSDEFEGEFDHDKWYNSDPKSWRGRVPGFFLPESMSVADGKLKLTCDILKKPIIFNKQEFTHRGAHIYSKASLLPGSYAECSMKANKTFMSSTFWLISVAKENEGCNKRTTELDIQECVGFPETQKKITQMGSNTHSRGIPKGCDVPTGSIGNHCEIGAKAYEDFHTYAAWWKSPTEILFYLDGEYKYTVNPKAEFNIPMVVKMVCETYNWSKPPKDGGMTGTFEERTTSYEWVRCYNSIPVGSKQSKSKSALNAIFEESVKFPTDKEQVTAKQINVCYSSKSEGSLTLSLKNESGKVVATTKSKVYSGMGNVPMKFKKPIPAGKYTATASLGSKHCVQEVTVK